MTTERQRHLVPADVNVGMMPCLLGECGHGVHKFHRAGKILELKRPRNHVVLPLPLRHGGECGRDLIFFQFWHRRRGEIF
jgi:hypothetical protein